MLIYTCLGTGSLVCCPHNLMQLQLLMLDCNKEVCLATVQPPSCGVKFNTTGPWKFQGFHECFIAVCLHRGTHVLGGGRHSCRHLLKRAS